jgi:hypothetical protein
MKSFVRTILESEFKDIMILNENANLISEDLQYHINNNISLTNNIFRYGSKKHLELINEVRKLYKNDLIVLNEQDEWIINTDAGERATYNDKVVLLDLPIEIKDNKIDEAEYKGKKVDLNKPKRNSGPGKKYVVYVKDPKTKNIRKITFGDKKGGLSAKVSDAKARKSFAARHNCKDKKDKTTAGYWACRINRYGNLWGGKTYPGFW